MSLLLVMAFCGKFRSWVVVVFGADTPQFGAAKPQPGQPGLFVEFDLGRDIQAQQPGFHGRFYHVASR